MSRLIASLIFLGCWGIFSAQQLGGLGPKEKTMRSEMRTRKQIRKEAKEKRKMEKEERRFVEKHHKRIQSKEVRKRMKSSRRTAMRNHDNKREFFVKRWFQRKNNGRTKVHKKD